MDKVNLKILTDVTVNLSTFHLEQWNGFTQLITRPDSNFYYGWNICQKILLNDDESIPKEYVSRLLVDNNGTLYVL